MLRKGNPGRSGEVPTKHVVNCSSPRLQNLLHLINYTMQANGFEYENEGAKTTTQGPAGNSMPAAYSQKMEQCELDAHTAESFGGPGMSCDSAREDVMIKVLTNLVHRDSPSLLKHFCVKYKSELDCYMSSAQTRTWGDFITSFVPPVTVSLDPATSEKIDMFSDTLRGLKDINITHKLPIATTEVFLWISLSTLFALKLKYPDMPHVTAAIGALCLFAGCMQFEKISKFISGLFGSRAQTLSSSVVPLIVEGASMLFFGSHLYDLKTFDCTALSKTFVMMNSGSIALTQFLTKFIDWLESVVTAISSYFGYKLKMSDNLYSVAINEYMEYADFLEKRLMSTDKPVSTADEFKVTSIVNTLYNMCHDLDKRKESGPTKFTVKLMLDRFRNLKDRIARACPGKGHRSAPFFAIMVGPAGTGKTTTVTLLGELAVALSLSPDELSEYEKDPSKFAPYTIPRSEKFWSGFSNTCKVLLLRDLFAATDKQGDKESDANLTIHIVSSEVLPVPQADLADKGQKFFTGGAAIADMNYCGGGKLPVKSVNHVPAMDRRLNEFAYMQVARDGCRAANTDTAFKLSVQSIGDDGFDAYTSKMDPIKAAQAVANGECEEDLWRFQKWNMLTAEPIGPFITWDQYCAEFIAAFKAHQIKVSKMTNSIKSRFSKILDSVKPAAPPVAVVPPVIDRSWNDVLFGDKTYKGQTKTYTDYIVDVASDVKSRMMVACGMVPKEPDVHDLFLAICQEYYDTMIEFEIQPHPEVEQFIREHTTIVGALVRKFRTFARLPRKCAAYLLKQGSVMVDILGIDAFAYAEYVEQSYEYFMNTIDKYVSAISSAAVKLYNSMPDMWWILRSTQFLAFSAGVVVCSAIVVVKRSLAWYSLTEVPSFAQTFSNVTQDEKFMNSILNNQVFMSYQVINGSKEGIREMNYGVFVVDRQMVSVAHCFDYPDYYHKKGDEVFILLYLMNNVSRTKPDFRIPYRDITFSKLNCDSNDLCIVNFPNTVKPFARIIDHFPSKDDHDLVSMLKTNGGSMKYFMAVDGVHVVRDMITKYEPNRAYTSGSYGFRDPFREINVDLPVKIHHSNGLSVTHTADGSCGLLGFATTPAIKSLVRKYPKANQPIITGIHVCGSIDYGHCAFLFKEYFNGITTSGPTSTYDQIATTLAIHHGALGPRASKDLPRPKDIFVAHAETRVGQQPVMFVDKTAVVRKSDFVRNPLYHNEAFKAAVPVAEKSYPANRGKIFRPDGTSFNSIDVSREKYGANTSAGLSLSASVVIGAHFDQDLMKHVAMKDIPPVGDRLDAYKRVITGSLGTSVLPRNKSVGPTLSALTDMKTRHDIFGEGIMPELGSAEELALREIVFKMLDLMRNGGDFAVIMRATLKDELRPVTRVIAGKSRIFSNGDLAFLILQMMYFSDMIKAFKATRITNGMLCGINPRNPNEWTALAVDLMQFGTNVLCTDFSGFDASCSELNWTEANTFQKLFYKDAPDGNPEREFIMKKMIDYVMIYNSDGVDEYTHFSRSLPSGLFLTSWFGSYVNLRTNFTACVSILIKHNSKQADPNIYLINQVSSTSILSACSDVSRCTVRKAYGDDSIFATQYESLFTDKALFYELHNLYGLVATNEVDDSITNVNGYASILDASIIARGFKPVVIGENNLFVAPVRMSTLDKSRWSKKSSTPDIERSRIDGLLQEAAFHGPEFHQSIVDAISDDVATAYSYRSPYTVFNVAFDAACSSEYQVYDGDEFVDRDLTSYGQTSMSPMKLLVIASSCLLDPLKAIHFDGPSHTQFWAQAAHVYLPPIARTTIGKLHIMCVPTHLNDTTLSSNCISVNFNELFVGTETVLGGNSVSTVRDVFRAQSSSSTMSMELSEGSGRTNHNTTSTVVCDSTGVTCFTEAEGIVRRSAPSMVTAPMQNYEETIAQFLSRPQNLSAVTWSTGTVNDTVLFSQNSIGSWLDTVPAWSNKTVGYALFKGTFVFRVELNAMKFQQGLLLIHYLPNYSTMMTLDYLYDKRVNTQMSHRMQHPHVIMSTSDTAAEIRIPFLSPEDYYRLGGAAGAESPDWGRVQIDVLSSLRVGPGQTATAADMSIYGYWEDVVLTAPSIAQSSNKPMKVKNRSQSVQAKELVPAGPIGPGLMSVATVADTLTDVPIIGEYMAPVSWALRLMGNVASYFGWSKPRVNVTQTIVAEQAHRYIANSDGPCTAIPLAVIHDNTTEVCLDRTSNGHDEMALKFLLGDVPNFTSRFVWNATDAVGANILTRLIGPKNLYHRQDAQTVAGKIAAYRSGGPLWYFGNIFSLWRGSIVLHLKIVKTMFHSGKIMITFTPSVLAVPPTTTINNSTLSLRQIIDIREQDEIHMTLPYMVPMKYLNTFQSNGSAVSNFSLDSTMGRLDIVIINDLKAPDTVAQTIEFVEWYTAGDDFEYQVPSGPNYIDEGVPTYISKAFPFVGQSSAGGTMIVNGGIAETKEEEATDYSAKSCVGEIVPSVKLLLQRLTFGYNGTQFPVGYKSFTIDPYVLGLTAMDLTTGALSAPSLYGDAVSFLAPLYLYMKGSMRVYINEAGSTTAAIHGMVVPNPNPSSLTRSFVTQTAYQNAVGSQASVLALGQASRYLPFASPSPSYNGLAHFQVPYYARQPVTYSNCTYDNSYPSPNKWKPVGNLAVSRVTNFSGNFSIGRSCGDDFQLSYFISCPSLLIQYV